MASVSPDLAEAKWPRAFPHTTIDGYTPDYLAAKARVKLGTVTLRDGRIMSYFTDGNKASGTPLLCLHGGGESKWMWLSKRPVPGAFMIALDRPGYGDSDAPLMKAVHYTFEQIVADVDELADLLEIDTVTCGVVWCGMVIGVVWCGVVWCGVVCGALCRDPRVGPQNHSVDSCVTQIFLACSLRLP